MTFVAVSTGYILRLVQGERIAQNIIRFCQEKKIAGAHLSAIGGVTEIELGFYSLEKKEYEFKKITETLELTGLLGNISLVDQNPFLHAHATVANFQFHVFGGHFKEGIVGGTCEIHLVIHGDPLIRQEDPETGLKLLQLPYK